MSHFLSRLVDRARGTAPRVEPRIASRFERVSPSEEDFLRQETATILVRPGAADGRQAASTDRARRPPPGATAEAQPTATVEHPPRSASPTGESSSPETASLEARAESLLVPRHNGQERPSASPPPRAKSEPIVSTGDRSARPARREVSARHFAEESRQGAPIVRVTIGRVEVRAAQAPAVPPRATKPTARPTLTLDAYLNARKEGRR